MIFLPCHTFGFHHVLGVFTQYIENSLMQNASHIHIFYITYQSSEAGNKYVMETKAQATHISCQRLIRNITVG